MAEPPDPVPLSSTAATSADAASNLAQGLAGYSGSFPDQKHPSAEGQRPESQESQGSDSATRCPAGSDDGEDTRSGSGGATSAAAADRTRVEDVSSREGFEDSGSSSFGEPGQRSAQDGRRASPAAAADNSTGADADGGSAPAATEEGEGSPAGASSEKPLPSLRQDGAIANAGSVGHPDECKACAFYCYSLRGCRNGDECTYCHLFHESKLRQRREEWKKTQREKRAKHRDKQKRDEDEMDDLICSGAGAAPEGGPPPTFLAPGFRDPVAAAAANSVATAGVPWVPGMAAACASRTRPVAQTMPQKTLAPAPTLLAPGGAGGVVDGGMDGRLLRPLVPGAQGAVAGRVAMPVAAKGVASNRGAPPAASFGAAADTYTSKGGRTSRPGPAAPPAQAVPPHPQAAASSAPGAAATDRAVADRGLRSAAAAAIKAGLPAALAGAEVFAYTPESIVVGVGQLIELWPPVHLISANLVFAVSPDLPQGLALDGHVGLIHGKPQEPTDGMVTYFVTACAPGDASLRVKMAVVRIKVMDVRVPGHVPTSIVQTESGETVVTFKETPASHEADLTDMLLRGAPAQWSQPSQPQLLLQQFHLQQQQQQQQKRQEHLQQLEHRAQEWQQQQPDNAQQAHRTVQEDAEIREMLTRIKYAWDVRSAASASSSGQLSQCGGVLTF